MLRAALFANAALSGICGAILLIWHESLSHALLRDGLIGMSATMFLILNGLGLLSFALLVLLVAAPADPSPSLVKAIMAMDVGWVVATLVLLLVAAASFTGLGKIMVLTAVILVAGIAAIQAREVRRRSSPSAG